MTETLLENLQAAIFDLHGSESTWVESVTIKGPSMARLFSKAKSKSLTFMDTPQLHVAMPGPMKPMKVSVGS